MSLPASRTTLSSLANKRPFDANSVAPDSLGRAWQVRWPYNLSGNKEGQSRARTCAEAWRCSFPRWLCAQSVWK